MSGPERPLILAMSVSLDGFVARTDGVIDRLSSPSARGVDHGDRRHRATLELLGKIGTIVIGRGAYEDMVQGWPGSDSPMAVLMNTLPKVVFSQSLSEVTWSSARLSRAPLEDEVPALKREPGKDLLAHGGATLARALSRERLVDEYLLTIQPAALGAGLPMFGDLGGSLHLELVEARTFSIGTALHVYRPRGT